MLKKKDLIVQYSSNSNVDSVHLCFISLVSHFSLFSQSVDLEEPTKENDPYQMDDYYSRKISDEELSKAEEDAIAYTPGSSSSSVMSSLEAHSKAFIDKVRISNICKFMVW